MAEVHGENDTKIVVGSAAYGRIRVGLIDGRRILPLQARDHHGIDLTIDAAKDLRDALDETIADAL